MASRFALLCMFIVLAFAFTSCGRSKEKMEAAYQAALATQAASAAMAEAAASAKAAQMEAEAVVRAQHEAENKTRSAEDLIASLKSKVSAVLKDPDSAQFRVVRLADNQTTLCGEVNSKNSFGGYVGFRPFIVSREEVLIAAPTSGGTSFDQDLMTLKYLTALKSSGCAAN